MAKASRAAKIQVLKDHEYDRGVLQEACDGEELEEMLDIEEKIEENPKVSHDHTPLPSPNPKKLSAKAKDNQPGEITIETVFNAIQALIKRFDEKDDRLKIFESRMEANTQAAGENKEEISKMKEEVVSLRKENISLKQMCLEQARCKRKWDLILLGFPEKEKENTRDCDLHFDMSNPAVNGEALRLSRHSAPPREEEHRSYQQDAQTDNHQLCLANCS